MKGTMPKFCYPIIPAYSLQYLRAQYLKEYLQINYNTLPIQLIVAALIIDIIKHGFLIMNKDDYIHKRRSSQINKQIFIKLGENILNVK